MVSTFKHALAHNPVGVGSNPGMTMLTLWRAPMGQQLTGNRIISAAATEATRLAGATPVGTIQDGVSAHICNQRPRYTFKSPRYNSYAALHCAH